MHIPEYTQGTWTNHEPRRRRKLLLHRDEIEKIGAKTRESGLTIVPLSLYFKDGRAKVEIARGHAARRTTTSARPCASARTTARPTGR